MRTLSDALVRFVNPTPEEIYGNIFARHPVVAAIALIALPLVGIWMVAMLP